MWYRKVSIIGVLLWANVAVGGSAPRVAPSGACFLLLDTTSGHLTRGPDDICTTRLPPASTFKIAHALAALDSGVISGAGEVIRYDGAAWRYEAWRRDHTLASAMRYSVLWYFQAIARRLGMKAEREYLHRLQYGNADPSSGLTTFWLGGSLRISPQEELTFLRRLYDSALPVREESVRAVRDILVQPAGVVVNAVGQHPFDAPWPPNTVVSAKTGSASFDGNRGVRWLVGHVRRDRGTWIFVSCVAGPADLDAMAAVELAARRLRAEHVL